MFDGSFYVIFFSASSLWFRCFGLKGTFFCVNRRFVIIESELVLKTKNFLE